ncbi:unnamed protein product [Staurois parvus]|uniref:Uncharacterized protein n=1 Tax=Staurois parvus TaxID=386267 RepID=A0ABN9AZM2_9NEOB|nr:unnamed protein product [Staurois parvus]
MDIEKIPLDCSEGTGRLRSRGGLTTHGAPGQ